MAAEVSEGAGGEEVSETEFVETTLRATEMLEEALHEIADADEHVGAGAVSVPIAYGSVAFWLGRRRPQAGVEVRDTHRWTVYVRGLDGRDIGYCVKKVVFRLHPTFRDPIRVVERPPFELTETGWGEFEVRMRLHFWDESLPPLEIAHLLRLFPPSAQQLAVGRPVVSEFLDELVFNEPATLSAEARDRLLAGPGPAPPPHPIEHLSRELAPEADLARLSAAHAFVLHEVARLSERLARADAEREALDADLDTLGWPLGRAEGSAATASSSSASSGAAAAPPSTPGEDDARSRRKR